MQKIFVFLLSCVIVCPALSDCVSTADITKCARIPENFQADMFLVGGRGDYTDNSWRTIRNYWRDGESVGGHYYSGTQAVANGSIVTCYMTSPFVATITLDVEGNTTNPYRNCGPFMQDGVYRSMSDITKLPDDVCPDGFYTVPYDISCGEGFVDTTDVPSCADDTSGDFCSTVNRLPCTSGLSVLRTGSGLSYQLWAEKYTEPSLCVAYNGQVCYISLAPGKAQDALNLNYNGSVFHAIN